MKFRNRIISAVLTLFMMAALIPATVLPAAAADGALYTEFSAMTFNIKNTSFGTSYENMVKYQQKPDIVGLQEVTSTQWNSWQPAMAATPNPSTGIQYGAYQGQYRGTTGAFQQNECEPIFYNIAKFTFKEGGTFWLSDTPNTASKYSDSEYNRICTWALLQVNGSANPAQYVLFMNVHLDSGGRDSNNMYTYTATAKQAKVLLQQMVSIENSIKGNSSYGIGGEDILATVIGGDFNVQAGHGIMKYVEGLGNWAIDGTNQGNTITGKRLSRAIAMTSNRSYNSFPGAVSTATVYSDSNSAYLYDFDHLLATTRNLNCNEYKIVCSISTEDHLPVISKFQLKQAVDSAKLSLLNIDEEDASFTFYKDGATTPAATTSLTCAPTSLNLTGQIKFFNDRTQTGDLKTYIDEIDIYDGPVQTGAYTPVNTPANVETPPSGGGGTTTYSEPNTPALYAGYNDADLGVRYGTATTYTTRTHTWGAGTVTAPNTVNTGTRAATFSGGALRLLNSTTVSGNQSSGAPGYINAAYNSNNWSTASLGSSSGATMEFIAKFDNLPRYTGASLPTTTSANDPVGQIGLIFDVPMRKLLYGGTANRPYEFNVAFMSYYNESLGGNEVVITNLTGSRNSINTAAISYVHTGVLIDDMNSYHRYTFSYDHTKSSNKLSVYVDGTLKGTSSGIMYRTLNLTAEQLYVTISNRSNCDPQTWCDIYLDSFVFYNAPLAPTSNLQTFANMYTTLSEAQPGQYTPASLEPVAGALSALKADTYGLPVLSDASGYPYSYSTTRINDRIADLQDAYDGLTPMTGGLIFTALINAVTAAEALKAPMYTQASWAVLQDALATVDYTVTTQEAVDAQTNAINSAIGALVSTGLTWYEDFSADAQPATLGNTQYDYNPVFLNGFWQYNIPPAPQSYEFNADSRSIQGLSVIGDETGVTIEFYMDLVSLPTRPTNLDNTPFRGMSVDAYLGGVDKMLTFALHAMTAAEKTANPGCDGWISLFNLKRSGPVVHLPVNLSLGDGMIHKYTFVYDPAQVRDLTGNVFGIFTDAACTDLVNSINVAGPITNSTEVPLHVNPVDVGSALQTYYIKQVAAADGYLLSNKVLTYTMRTTDLDQTIYLNSEASVGLSDAPITSLKAAPIYGTPYHGAYDGAAHYTLSSVTNRKPGRVTIAYSTDGTSYTSSIPIIQNPGTVTLYVRTTDNLTPSNYAPLIDTFEASVSYLLSLALSGNGSGDKVTVTVGSGTPTDIVSSPRSYIPNVTRGDTVTMTAAGGNFAYWKNVRTGKQLSTAATLQYPVGTQMDLEAVWIVPITDPTQDKDTVIFKNSITGKIIKTMEVVENYVIQLSDLPTASALYGYTFDKWASWGATTYDRVPAAGTTVTGEMTFYAFYQRVNPTYHTLTIVDGETTTRQMAFAKTISVTASGSNFAYWTLDGTILTTKATVLFGMPDADATLTAVYNQSAPSEILLNVVTCKVDTAGAFAIVYARDIPAGVTFVESGLLMTRKANPSDLYVGTTANVTKGVSTTAPSVTFYGFQKALNGKAGTWYIRGYTIYYDAQGNLAFAYSDVYSLLVRDGAAASGTPMSI